MSEPLASAHKALHDDRADHWDRRLAISFFVSTGGLFLLLALPLFSGRVYLCQEVLRQTIPLRIFLKDCLQAGASPDWFPGYFCGFFLHGSGDGALDHPAIRLLCTFCSVETAVMIEIVLAYVLTWAGTGLFLRRVGFSRAAAWGGAVTFAFSGFVFLRMVHVGFLESIAHMPWALLCLDAMLTSPSRKTRALAGLGLGLVTGSQLLLGHPQSSMLSWVLEAAWAVWILWGSGARGRIWLLLAAKGLGACIGLAQLLPMREAGERSTRQTIDAGFQVSYSLHPANLVQPVAPYVFQDRRFPDRTEAYGETGNAHEFSLYAGAVAVVLVVWLLANRRSLPAARKHLLAWCAVVGLLALLLAMGRYGGLYWIQTRLPLVKVFRVPSRYLLLVHFVLAVVFAVGVEHFLRRLGKSPPASWKSHVPLFLPLIAGLLIAGGAWIVQQDAERVAWLALKPSSLRNTLLLSLGPALLAAAGVLLALAERGHRWVLLLMPALIAGDMGLYGLSNARRPAPDTVAAVLARYPFPPDAHGGRVEKRRLLDNIWTLRGYEIPDGAVQVDPQRILDYTQPAALRVASVYWRQHLPSGATTLDTHKPPPPSRWTRLQPFLPKARLVARALVSDDPAADLSGIDPAAVALVPAPLSLDAQATGTVGIEAAAPGRYRLAAQTTGTMLLVLSVRHHPDWTVRVDGVEAPLVRVYGDFMGCVLAPGAHTVSFGFVSASHALGRRLSVAGAVLLLLLFAGLYAADRVRCRNRGGA